MTYELDQTNIWRSRSKNFLVDGTGHVKLIDFGLPEHWTLNKLNRWRLRLDSPILLYHRDLTSPQLDKVNDDQIIRRSTMAHHSIYRSICNEDSRYADSIVGSPDYMNLNSRACGVRPMSTLSSPKAVPSSSRGHGWRSSPCRGSFHNADLKVNPSVDFPYLFIWLWLFL